MQVLKTHQFINSQQITYFNETKANLPFGKVLAVGDFSQNYSFVVQDAAQGIHWSNAACTLHPWMCYYRGQGGTIESHSVLFISDCLTHETVQVYPSTSSMLRC